MHLDKSLFVSTVEEEAIPGGGLLLAHAPTDNWVLKLILLVLSQNHAFLGYQHLMSCCFTSLKLLPFWSARTEPCQCTVLKRVLLANSFLGMLQLSSSPWNRN